MPEYTPELRAKVDAAMARATEGEWRVFSETIIAGHSQDEQCRKVTQYVCGAYYQAQKSEQGADNANAIVALHNAYPALTAKIDADAERIAEMEQQVERLRRCLFPVHMAMLERECIDEPLPDDAVVLSFMGSGASDQVTAGQVRAALKDTAQ